MTAREQPVRPLPHDAHLRATPDTVSWGHIRVDREPVLRIRPGQTVRIDTVSHQGLTTSKDPVDLFGVAGISPAEVLPEATEIYRTVKRAEGAGAHVVTGPIHVEGVRAGDMLEVRVLDVEFRVPYGINATGPGRGAAPEFLSQPAQKIIQLDLARNVALFASGVEVPLAPFMGIVAVAPPPETPRVSTRPPGPFGGNLDFKHLVAGSTLYLPVFNDGALFYTGDGHGVQGDGEVDGTAIEISLTPTMQFFAYRGAGATMKWPQAEDAKHHYVMGMAQDLDAALRNAVTETACFLQRRAGLTEAEAYALCSLAVDFRIGEAVNSVVMVYGMIPKTLFRQETGYWA
jgi:acetamidase/formamidase